MYSPSVPAQYDEDEFLISDMVADHSDSPIDVIAEVNRVLAEKGVHYVFVHQDEEGGSDEYAFILVEK